MRGPLGGSAFFLGSDSYRSETRYALFRTKSNRNDSFSDRGFPENIRNRLRMHNMQNIHPCFLHKTSCICNTYARNYTSFHKGTMDGTRTIYRWDMNNLYIWCELSIDGRRTVYIWKTDHLFSAYRPSVFLLLELYVFLYCTVSQWNADIRSFLFVLPCNGTEIWHSRYA